MKNPYTCDNCLHNPSQYNEIGTKTGFCLKHGSLLKSALQTTCHFHLRKDLPFFLYEEGRAEHAAEFPEALGIVFYDGRYPMEMKSYSARQAWLNNAFDPYIHEVAIYGGTSGKWTFIQAFISSRNPIKSIISSSLTRRYILNCGPEQDHYRLILSLSNDLREPLDLRMDDFIWPIAPEEFSGLRDHYLKDIKLLQLYAIQEYGMLTRNEEIAWIADELDGALLGSWNEFSTGIWQLAPVINRHVIEASQKRGTFFPRDDLVEDALECAAVEP